MFEYDFYVIIFCNIITLDLHELNYFVKLKIFFFSTVLCNKKFSTRILHLITIS